MRMVGGGNTTFTVSAAGTNTKSLSFATVPDRPRKLPPDDRARSGEAGGAGAVGGGRDRLHAQPAADESARDDERRARAAGDRGAAGGAAGAPAVREPVRRG